MATKRRSAKSSPYPVWGWTCLIIAVFAFIIMYLGIQEFLGMMESVESSEELGALIGAILIFSTIGAQTLLRTIIAGIFFVIFAPLSIKFFSEGK